MTMQEDCGGTDDNAGGSGAAQMTITQMTMQEDLIMQAKEEKTNLE